jgi:hypothetical protein
VTAAHTPSATTGQETTTATTAPPKIKKAVRRAKPKSTSAAQTTTDAGGDSASSSSNAEVYSSAPPTLKVDLLPEQNLGVLRGGQYPFLYDPVYGLPIVRSVKTYAQVRFFKDFKVFSRFLKVLKFFQEILGLLNPS